MQRENSFGRLRRLNLIYSVETRCARGAVVVRGARKTARARVVSRRDAHAFVMTRMPSMPSPKKLLLLAHSNFDTCACLADAVARRRERSVSEAYSWKLPRMYLVSRMRDLMRKPFSPPKRERGSKFMRTTCACRGVRRAHRQLHLTRHMQAFQLLGRTHTPRHHARLRSAALAQPLLDSARDVIRWQRRGSSRPVGS